MSAPQTTNLFKLKTKDMKTLIQAVFYETKKNGFYSPKYFMKEQNKEAKLITEQVFMSLTTNPSIEVLAPIYKDIV